MHSTALPMPQKRRIVALASGLSCVLLLLGLSGCAQPSTQETYKEKELGISQAAEFGTISHVREITVIAKNKGTGALIGAGAGAGGGSYVGDGSGNAWAAAGGAIAGAVIGNAIETEMNKSPGHEYTLQMLDGEIKTIALPYAAGDTIFAPGDKVMLQYCDSGKRQKKCYPGTQFQRLLPVDNFPETPHKKTKRGKAKSKHSSSH